MNILLVYPQIPDTFWNFKNALKFVSKKSSEPPLGLLTVAALLPQEWNIKLIDMNVSQLADEQIKWADYVFISAMDIQRASFLKVVKRCNLLATKVVAGGPMVTCGYESFLGVDHFILNEAEITLPLFLADLKKNRLHKVYQNRQFPDITQTPVPRWDLLERNKYANLSVQYSRGCPYDCEFCSITVLNGHRPRTKSTGQFLAELNALYKLGWRGGVFVVDDNFIGNRRKLKNDLLPALVRWSLSHNYPFSFYTEASINLADDQKLMDLMVRAGFDHAFIGIETPSDAGLAECGKTQNRGRDLVAAVKKMHSSGLRVSAGFIVGFDSDSPGVFRSQIRFIQNSHIVTAMVGLLNAPSGTKLFERLRKEKRLLENFSGNNMDGAINFIPKMDYRRLISGYKEILQSIYAPRAYYTRVKEFLTDYKLPTGTRSRISLSDIRAFLRSLWVLGIRDPGKKYYWSLLVFCLRKYPRKFSMAVTLAIYGFHFRLVSEQV